MMQGIWSLLFLSVFDCVHGESVIVPQENFHEDQFMGKWYEVAVVSDCPHYMQNKKGNPDIVALVLKPSEQGNITVLATTPRNGSCKQTSTQYASTDTAGQFYYHVIRLSVDVDASVVRTDYNQYAMMGLLSTERASQNKTAIFKLYTRSVDVSHAVLDNFKTLVRAHGMRDDSIIVNENKGFNTCL